MKENLIEEIKKAKEITKDYNKFKHIFSEDEGVSTLAHLNRTLQHIELMLEMSEAKDVAHPQNNALEKPMFGKQGALVSVRPCADKYENKTYLGFLSRYMGRRHIRHNPARAGSLFLY